MFVVLEGIDGCGKSSLAELVAKRCEGVTYATPPEEYKRRRKSIDVGSDITRHYEFYCEAVREASREIGNILSAGRSVVCDRYWLTTVVYHRAGKLKVDLSDFSGLVQPDLTVLLLVSRAEQERRERARHADGGNIDGFQLEITNLYWAALLESNMPFIAINTDHIDLERSADIVMAAIGQMDCDSIL